MHQSLKQKKVENQFGLNRGVVYWHYAGLGVRRTEFDSLHPDQNQKTLRLTLRVFCLCRNC